ncbi:MAG TPA: cytochrome c [Vicinamibacterales bacterium]|nr:cytochrome c [Vicinamibacterales bacterium]
MNKTLGVGIGCGILVMLAVVHAHDPVTRVTWNTEIARIVQARCVACHSPDGRGPMSLVTYEDARPWAKAIKEEVLTRRMPKWHAVRGYGDFRNDPSLSSFEIALIVAWADGGAPRGAPVNPSATANGERPAHADDGRPAVITMTVPCGERPLPEGTLVAVEPDTVKEGSIGMAVQLPDGRREIVGWIRDFDPDFATTYWLRSPLTLPPGSILSTEPRDGCRVTLSLARR